MKMNLVRRVEETLWSNGQLQAYGEHGTLKTEPEPYAVSIARRVPILML